MERTLVLIKPDAVQRGLIGEIIKRLEERGLQVLVAKFMNVSVELAERHYAVHKGKAFYDGLITYITSSPVMAMVWEGPNAIASVRGTMGDTDPSSAQPGSIRHDLALSIGRNITHASDSSQTADAEIPLWFEEQEIVSWERSLDRWILEE